MLSWATGSGLPICCISGSAVTEAGTGSWCRALEEATVSKLFGNNYWIFIKWLCGHGDKQMAGWKFSCLSEWKSYKRQSLCRSLKLPCLIYFYRLIWCHLWLLWWFGVGMRTENQVLLRIDKKKKGQWCKWVEPFLNNSLIHSLHYVILFIHILSSHNGFPVNKFNMLYIS